MANQIPAEALNFCAMAAAPSLNVPAYEMKKDDFSWTSGTHFVDGSWIESGSAFEVESTSIDETIRRIKAKNVRIVGTGFASI